MLSMQELSQLPENDVTAAYVDAMAATVQEYGTDGAIVLFVVQPGEKNSYDQQVDHTRLPDSISPASTKTASGGFECIVDCYAHHPARLCF